LREKVSWHLGNIANTPPNFTYDVILCRNVLVYYTKKYQMYLINHIIDHLKPEGYVMLGMAETIPFEFMHKLTPVSDNYRIYRRLYKAGGTNGT
jgi:chemotaxis protein methyltransferase CheR